MAEGPVKVFKCADLRENGLGSVHQQSADRKQETTTFGESLAATRHTETQQSRPESLGR